MRSGTPTRVTTLMGNWMPAGVLAGLCILLRPCWWGPLVLGAVDAPCIYGVRSGTSARSIAIPLWPSICRVIGTLSSKLPHIICKVLGTLS